MIQNDRRIITQQGIWSVSTFLVGTSVLNLFDGCVNSYWLSFGFPPHSISCTFKESTFVSTINLFLSTEDKTFFPQDVEVYIGDTDETLHLTTKTVLEYIGGWQSIVVNKHCIYLRIDILKNYDNGKDTKIRMLRLEGEIKTNGFDKSLQFLSPRLQQFSNLR